MPFTPGSTGGSHASSSQRPRRESSSWGAVLGGKDVTGGSLDVSADGKEDTEEERLLRDENGMLRHRLAEVEGHWRKAQEQAKGLQTAQQRLFQVSGWVRGDGCGGCALHAHPGRQTTNTTHPRLHPHACMCPSTPTPTSTPPQDLVLLREKYDDAKAHIAEVLWSFLPSPASEARFCPSIPPLATGLLESEQRYGKRHGTAKPKKPLFL